MARVFQRTRTKHKGQSIKDERSVTKKIKQMGSILSRAKELAEKGV